MSSTNQQHIKISRIVFVEYVVDHFTGARYLGAVDDFGNHVEVSPTTVAVSYGAHCGE